MPRADGSILIKADVDVSEADKELGKLRKSIGKTEEEIEELTAKKDAASEKSVFSAAELDAEKAKLSQMKRELEEIRAISKDTSLSASVRSEAKQSIPDQKFAVSEQQARVNMLQTEYNKVANAVDRYGERLDEAKKKLDKQTDRAGELVEQINSVSRASQYMAKAQDTAQKSLNRFGLRLREVVRSALVFTLITQSLAAFREWMGKVIRTNSEATAAFARLKGALLTLAQPLVEVLIPAMITFVNILTKVVAMAAQLVSFLFGKTAKQSAEAAESLNKETEALNDVGKAAKKAEGSLAGFDEINTIATETRGGASSETIAPSFDFDTTASEDNLKNLLGWIEAIGAALAAWKIGSAFGLSLKETIGLAMGIYEAFQFVKAIADAWANGVTWDNLLDMLLSLTGAAIGFGIAFGAVGAGIALIVGGIAMIATGFHDAMKNGWDLENLLTTIAGIFATGIGIALLTGSWIPLLIAGIASLLLAFTVATGHGEELLDGVRKILEGFVDFFTGIFTGDIEKAIGGIEKIFDGLGETVDAVIDGVRDTFLSFLDWLDEKTNGKLKPVIDFVKGLVNGLCDSLIEVVDSTVDGLKDIFSGLIIFLTGVFTNDWSKAWEGVKQIFKGIWNGIVGLLESAINLIINGANWLITQLNKISFDVPDWVPEIGGKSLGVNIPKISSARLPRLATGAVVPPNREFMAILGDNKQETEVVSPLSTMKQAVLEALQEAGGFGGGTVTVVVNLDGKEVARNTVKHVNDMTRQAGKPVLLF